MPVIETMTMDELDRRMREEYGMKTSKERLADAIEQGLYPFAICIKRPENNKRLFEIYTKKFEEWANDLAR